MSRLCLLFLLLLLTISPIAAGQSAEPGKPSPTDIAKAKNETEDEAERLLRERRANAQSLLISLAADAGNYTDQRLRARTVARIADALWDADPERARAMFRKAWDAAEVVDEESRRITLEEIRQQQARRGSAAIANRGSIRNEVLRLAARRDRKLGEELLARFTAEKKDEAAEAADRARSNLFETPEAITQRLNLARQLLDSDVERSIQFADPALMTVTRDGIDYLSYLREKDAVSADRRYAALLGRAAGDAKTDANTISLLTSYLFTPHIFVQFNGGGANTSSTGRTTPAPVVAPELRAAFFRAAADVLLRPLAPPGQDQTTSGVVGKYLMMKRLMPLFEQFAGKETTDAVRAHMEALANNVSEGDRLRDDESMREGIRPLENTEDQEKSLLDKIDRTKPGEQRDQLYIQLARVYSQNGDMRAREIVEKIEDTDVRNQARLFTDATLVINGIEKKDIDRVLEIVRIGSLTLIQKAYTLTQAAKLVYKTDLDRALSLLEQADTEARRIETSDADRPRALMAIANTYLLVDRKKAWDQVADVTKAANSAPTFTGEDGMLRITLLTKGMSSIRSSTVREFDVAPVFADLANEDYARTIELARLFEKEGPRASATIAIAKAMLDEKKK
ncbi:MAG TPA: hypothetical protein VFZ40_02735 [Pyrinomonadaceae bacterium]